MLELCCLPRLALNHLFWVFFCRTSRLFPLLMEILQGTPHLQSIQCLCQTGPWLPRRFGAWLSESCWSFRLLQNIKKKKHSNKTSTSRHSYSEMSSAKLGFVSGLKPFTKAVSRLIFQGIPHIWHRPNSDVPSWHLLDFDFHNAASLKRSHMKGTAHVPEAKVFHVRVQTELNWCPHADLLQTIFSNMTLRNTPKLQTQFPSSSWRATRLLGSSRTTTQQRRFTCPEEPNTIKLGEE